MYSVLGDIPATSYFTVDSNTGVVSARADLMLDTTIDYVVSKLMHCGCPEDIFGLQERRR